jgi:hypothetical protein
MHSSSSLSAHLGESLSGRPPGVAWRATRGGHSSFRAAFPKVSFHRSLLNWPRLWKFAVAVFLASGLPLEAGAGAATFTFTTFDPPGSTSTTPSGITEDGVIIGYYTDASGVVHGFMRHRNGTIKTFDPPGSTLATPTSINPDGEIAGAYCDTAACASSFGVGARGFLRASDGTFVTFAAPAGQILAGIFNFGGPPPDLTPAGAIAGTYSVLGPPFAEHGFVRHRNGTIKTIDVPGATLTEVLGGDHRILP